MDFVEDTVKGTLTIMDSGMPVLTYRFGDQLKEGVDARFARSCYIHPLYSLDGGSSPLTSPPTMSITMGFSGAGRSLRREAKLRATGRSGHPRFASVLFAG